MEYSEMFYGARAILELRDALTNPEIKKVIVGCATQKLSFVKDYLPDGTPCWRLPTEEEINDLNKEKTKDEI